MVARWEGGEREGERVGGRREGRKRREGGGRNEGGWEGREEENGSRGDEANFLSNCPLYCAFHVLQID